MQRALALVLLCQDSKNSDYNFNVPSSFNINTFKLKACFIPAQNDEKSCGVIVMMAIYQIYIQGKHIDKLYDETNHKVFWRLFFNTLFSVIMLF